MNLRKFRTNDANESKSETLTIWKCPYCKHNKWVNKNQIHEHLKDCKEVSDEKKYSKDGLQFELPLWRPEVLLEGAIILESVGEHHYANRIIMDMVIC